MAVATAPAGGVDLGPVIAEEPRGRGLDGKGGFCDPDTVHMTSTWYFHGISMVFLWFPMGL